MSLASLLNPPSTEREFLRWSFSNDDGHRRIISAIFAQTGIDLTTYVLDPIPQEDLQSWSRRHQTTHNDFTGVLGIQGSDLTDVDWKKKDEVDSWLRLHFDEHRQANFILGI
jgi:hypothetical protein